MEDSQVKPPNSILVDKENEAFNAYIFISLSKASEAFSKLSDVLNEIKSI